jgi:hypothetical protein
MVMKAGSILHKIHPNRPTPTDVDQLGFTRGLKYERILNLPAGTVQLDTNE